MNINYNKKMIITLTATLSYIKYGKLFFAYSSFDVRNKLQKINAPYIPYNDKEFWTMAHKYNNYEQWLGNVVEVVVKPIKYSFTDKKTGDLIEGYKFLLVDMKPSKF